MSVTSTRTRSPRGEGEQLRDELLLAAAALLGEHGSIDKVSLRAVASRTGVSPTAVYRHFANHEELMIESVLSCWKAFDDAVCPVLDGDGDPFAMFQALGDAYVDFAMADIGRYNVLFADDLLHLPRVQEASLLIFAKLVDLVDRMLQANGDRRDSFFVATQVQTFMHGMILMCAHDHGEDIGNPFPPIEELLADLPARMGLEPKST